MRQTPMVSKMVEVQQVVEVLEEEADLLKYPDQQSVEDVARRSLIFSKVNGTDM